MTIALFIVQILVTMLLALVGFVMKRVMDDLKAIAIELKEFQQEVNKNGVMKHYFEEYRKETRDRIHNIADRLGAIEGAFKVLYKVDLKAPPV